MTNSTSACCRFIQCVFPCCFSQSTTSKEKIKKQKSLTRYENNTNSPPLSRRKVKLLSTEMINIRQVLHESMPSKKQGYV